MTPTPEAIVGAQAADTKWGIPASITLAQWALESGWGQSMPMGSNNPFGIKALPGQPSVTVQTREVDRYGRSYYVVAPFAKFPTLAAAFDAHGKLLAQAACYAPARKHLPDPIGFANALTGVYATDPHYGAALCSLMAADGLYAYNKAASVPKGVLKATAIKAPPVQQHPTTNDDAVVEALNERALAQAQTGQAG